MLNFEPPRDQILVRGSRFHQVRIYNSHVFSHSYPINCCAVVFEKRIFKHVPYIFLCLLWIPSWAPPLHVVWGLRIYNLESLLCKDPCTVISQSVTLYFSRWRFLNIFLMYFFEKFYTPLGAPLLVLGSWFWQLESTIAKDFCILISKTIAL